MENMLLVLSIIFLLSYNQKKIFSHEKAVRIVCSYGFNDYKIFDKEGEMLFHTEESLIKSCERIKGIRKKK